MKKINYWEFVITVEVVRTAMMLEVARIACMIGQVASDNCATDTVKIADVSEDVLRTIHPNNTSIKITIEAGLIDNASICDILRLVYSKYDNACLQSIKVIDGES